MNTSPARAALAAHQDRLTKLLSDSDTLARRAESFRVNVAAYTNDSLIEGLRDRRREVLADVATGVKPMAVLSLFDQELSQAEQKYRDGRLEAELAAAGAQRLTAQHAELAQEITVLSNQLPALKYAALLEVAEDKLPAYRNALEQLGAATAELMGACAAVDSVADLFVDPKRLPVTGELRQTQFGATLPALPGVDPKEWTFDIAAQATQVMHASLASLEG